MPVLGADPDRHVDPQWYEWDEVAAQGGSSGYRPGWMYNTKLMSLVNYFAYHPGMSMNQRCDLDDKGIMARWANRKLKGGYTEAQIKQAIDRFFESYAKEFNHPALAIQSKEIEPRLFEAEWRTFDKDPHLDWIAAGMPDGGPFDDPQGTRSLLLLHCPEGQVRYPEIVLMIIKGYGTMRVKRDQLAALEYIIKWNLGDESDRSELRFSQQLLKHFDPPTELMSSRPGNLRPAQPNMQRALELMVNREQRTD